MAFDNLIGGRFVVHKFNRDLYADLGWRLYGFYLLFIAPEHEVVVFFEIHL
jgi:hypothetical protein